MKQEFTKEYVAVTVDIDTEGCVRPRTVTLEDEGTFEIDQILRVVPAASTKVGGCGTRYTIRIDDKRSFLFDEDGRWFIERPVVNW